MVTTMDSLAVARRHLDVLEESWSADHAAALECRELEAWLAEAAMVFDLIDLLTHLRREGVFRGLEEASPERDVVEKDLHGRWLSLVGQQLPRLATLEKTFGVVEGAERLRTCHERAASFLATWSPAAVACAVGSRVIEFSEEDADQIRTLLHSPPGSPGRPPYKLPEGDPSLLR
jgi:hypothetical protein